MIGSAKPTASRTDVVRDTLVDRISTGQLQPGDRLPAERTLAAEFGVSRNVVREALGTLAAMRLVDTKPGSGVYVAELSMSTMLRAVDPALALRPSSLRVLLQVREVLEPGVASLAAQLAAPEELDALHDLLVESERRVDDIPAFLELDGGIHDAITRMSRNPVLIWISDGLRRSVREAREITIADPDRRRRALSDHRAIFEAIAARDPARAFEAMSDHLVTVQHHLLPFATKLAPHAGVRSNRDTSGQQPPT